MWYGVAWLHLADQHYDHSKLGRVLQQLRNVTLSGDAGSEPLHVVVCCTVIPGYMDDVAAELLDIRQQSEGSRSGRPLTLSYNPLFIAQGTILAGMRAPNLVLIGQMNEESVAGLALQRLWGRVIAPTPSDLVVRKMPMLSAEVAKLSLNCYGELLSSAWHIS
eukprot:SAG31_NODE_135_length_23206_cov_25.707967_28_plen_163_part_00